MVGTLTRETSAHPGPPSIRPLYAVLLLGAFAYSLLQSLVVPALPAIRDDLHTTTAATTWAFTGFLISTAVATPIVGRLSDMFGRARVLLAVLVALTVGTLVCALATNITTLLVGRFVQGIGGGFFAVAFGIVRDEFPRRRVAGVIGVISAMLAVAGTAGLSMSGWIVDSLSWHWLFWFSLVLDIVTLGLAARFVPRHRGAGARRLDITGAVLLSAWLVALLLAVSEGPRWGWRSPGVVGLALGAVALLVTWVSWEQRQDEPLVELALLTAPAVWRVNLATMLFGFSLYAAWATFPIFVQVSTSTGWGLGASHTAAGAYLAPSSVATFLAGLATGRLERRWGSRSCLVVGAGIAASMFATMAVFHAATWQVLLISTVAGFGQGLAFASTANIVVASVPHDQVGVAVGINTNARTIGGAVGAQIATTVIAAGAHSGRVAPESAFIGNFAMFAAVFAVAAVVASLLPRRLERVSESRGLGVESAASAAAGVPAGGD